MVSIIVPALNEAGQIADTLRVLQDLCGDKEVLVVDGGSADRTADIARAAGVRVIESEPGRGTQMHVGAVQARGDVLWFVHADTAPPPEALQKIEAALRDPSVAGGNFGLLFDGGTRAARQLTTVYPFLRYLNLCYGDSGIFVRREIYTQIGGFRRYPLFEDLDLLKRVRRAGKFVHLPCRITTSSRRFENRNFAGMWAQWTALQVLYWAGISPYALARWYGHARKRPS